MSLHLPSQRSVTSSRLANLPLCSSSVTQSCLILYDPMDCSPSGSSVCGILQARILEWVAIPFSGGSSRPGIEPGTLALQADSLPSEPPRDDIAFGKLWTGNLDYLQKPLIQFHSHPTQWFSRRFILSKAMVPALWSHGTLHPPAPKIAKWLSHLRRQEGTAPK